MDWHVIVLSKPDGRELARYTYNTRARAQEARRDIADIRIKQNRESVNVIVRGANQSRSSVGK